MLDLTQLLPFLAAALALNLTPGAIRGTRQRIMQSHGKAAEITSADSGGRD